MTRHIMMQDIQSIASAADAFVLMYDEYRKVADVEVDFSVSDSMHELLTARYDRCRKDKDAALEHLRAVVHAAHGISDPPA